MKRCSRCGEIKPLEEFHRDSSRDGRMYQCKLCRREVRMARYAQNRDEYRARKKEWYAQNREEQLAKVKAWYAVNGAVVREASSTRYATNQLRSDEAVAADRARLRPSGTKACSECGMALPLDRFSIKRGYPDGLHNVCRSCNTIQKRRSRTKARTHLVKYWMTQGIAPDRCYVCNIPVHGGFEVDHLIPTARGGTSDPVNLLPACREHNRSKGCQDILVWLPTEYEHRREWIAARVAACADAGILYEGAVA